MDNSVKGKLKSSVIFWKNTIEASDDIISIIKNGYAIPFVNKPPSFLKKNNSSALKNKSFVEKSIFALIEKQCVYEVPFIPHNVNPLSVATNNSSNKQRLILELSILNTYVRKDKFKFEDHKVAKEFIIPNGYMFKFDLTSGYHHTYLGFSWVFNGIVKYFVFSVLPFGLSSAPICFPRA